MWNAIVFLSIHSERDASGGYDYTEGQSYQDRELVASRNRRCETRFAQSGVAKRVRSSSRFPTIAERVSREKPVLPQVNARGFLLRGVNVAHATSFP